MKSLLLVSIFSVFILSCKSQQYAPDNLPETLLLFGNGGGITGQVKTYTLLKNGQLFAYNSLTEEIIELERIPKKEAKVYFEKINALNLVETNFNHPGNRYYFLESVIDEEKYRVTWGSNEFEVPGQYQLLYKELTSIIK